MLQPTMMVMTLVWWLVGIRSSKISEKHLVFWVSFFSPIILFYFISCLYMRLLCWGGGFFSFVHLCSIFLDSLVQVLLTCCFVWVPISLYISVCVCVSPPSMIAFVLGVPFPIHFLLTPLNLVFFLPMIHPISSYGYPILHVVGCSFYTYFLYFISLVLILFPSRLTKIYMLITFSLL